MTEVSAGRGGSGKSARRLLASVLVASALLAGCRREQEPAVASDTALPPSEGAGVASDPVATVATVPAVASLPPADSAPPPPAVAEFIRFVETERATDSVSVARGYAADGLRLLATGIEALAARDTAGATTVWTRLVVLRARADSMQRAEDPLTRARLASEAFVLAGDLLQTLQEGVAQPALTDRAAEARQAAAAVRSDQPLLTQPAAVRRFFERSAAALRGLIGARTA